MNDAVQQHCLRFTGSDSIFGAIGYLQRCCPIFSAILARYIVNVVGIPETMPILGRSDAPPRDVNLVSFYRNNNNILCFYKLMSSYLGSPLFSRFAMSSPNQWSAKPHH